MRGLSFLAGAALLVGLAAGSAFAQDSDENTYRCWDELDEFTPEQSIAGCTAALRSGEVAAEDRPAMFAMRGWWYNDLGDHERAVADFAEKIRLRPDEADGYGWRATAYFDKGDFALALADYDEAIRLGPEEPDLVLWYHLRGVVHDQLGEFQRAIDDFRAALRIGGDDPVIYGDRGNVFLALGQYERALQDHTMAIELAPGEAQHWNNRCWVRAVWGQELDQALADCNEALTVEPGLAYVLDSRGLVRLRRQEWDAALADYQASVDIEPTASAHYGRGIALSRLGRADEASDSYATATGLDAEIAATYAGYGIEP